MEAHDVHELTAAYALDALDEHERVEYEEHLARCAECREQLASFSEAAAALAYVAESPAPPAALRDRILAQARAERPNVRPLRPRTTTWFAAASAAAACLAVGAGAWAVSLSRSLDHERAARGQQEQIAHVLGDPRKRALALSGDHGSVYVARGGRAVLVPAKFDRAPAGKTYEAWVRLGSSPRRAGTFADGSRPLLLGQNVQEGAQVMVTLERAGGVDQPTSAPLAFVRA
jgi:anti-sigma factor RsiW